MSEEQFNLDTIASLRRTMASMEEALAHIDSVIIWVDSEGKIDWCNKALEKLLERMRVLLLNKPVFDLIPLERNGKQLDFYEHPLGKPLQDGKPYLDCCDFVLPDGSRVLLEIDLSPFILPDASQSVVVCLRDITERRRLEEAIIARESAEASARTKSEFLANMSHELRTPLNGVIGMSDLLMTTSLDPQQKEYARTIQNSAQALINIVNDVLDLSKMEAGKLQIGSSTFNLLGVLENTASLLAPSAKEKGLDLVVRYPPDCPVFFLGDGLRVQQVVSNLVGNAIKFTREGYVLMEVEATEEEGRAVETDPHHLRVSVKDTGIGIESDKLESIFEQFTQADQSTTRHAGGTGLGLSICSRLTELMGGSMGVHSTVGKGSEFWFQIDLPEAEGPTELIPSTNLRGMHVLVVDDLDINRRILCEQLSSWDMIPHTASHAAEARKLLRASGIGSHEFALAILDYQLPGTSGEELGQWIRSQSSLHELKILMLTSAGIDEDADRMEAVGFDGYLVKPIRQSLLLDAITTIITRKTGAPMLQRQDILVRRQAAQHPTAEAQPFDQSVRVLLVEDHKVNQRIARKMLTYLNCQIDLAENGRQSIENIQAQTYQAVLMDCQMPEMDGYEATRAIRLLEDPVKARVPIIAMTAHAMAGDREKCLEAGMDDYLAKPITIDEVSRVLRRWVQLSEE